MLRLWSTETAATVCTIAAPAEFFLLKNRRQHASVNRELVRLFRDHGARRAKVRLHEGSFDSYYLAPLDSREGFLRVLGGARRVTIEGIAEELVVLGTFARPRPLLEALARITHTASQYRDALAAGLRDAG
jgi:hypothetical protein